MTVSFDNVIDPKVCKTVEYPQEQLHFKVPGDHSTYQMAWSRQMGTIRRLKCCSSGDLYCQCISNMWKYLNLEISKLKMHPTEVPTLKNYKL